MSRQVTNTKQKRFICLQYVLISEIKLKVWTAAAVNLSPDMMQGLFAGTPGRRSAKCHTGIASPIACLHKAAQQPD